MFEKGVNDSFVHVDFMIGTEDLMIDGILEDGSHVKSLKMEILYFNDLGDCSPLLIVKDFYYILFKEVIIGSGLFFLLK